MNSIYVNEKTEKVYLLYQNLFNSVFHIVTPVAHGLKLVITRKINLKNFFKLMNYKVVY